MPATEPPASVHRIRHALSAWLGGALLLLGLALLPLGPRADQAAHAQDTGGSFGGGDFGGGGGGSDFGGGGGGSDFGGGSSYGGSSDYGSSSYGGSASSGGPVEGPSSGCCAFMGIVLVVLLIVIFLSTFGQGGGSPGGGGDAPGGMDVSAIRIALAHNARPTMQAKLDALARSGAASSKAGRAAALHEVCIELRRNETAWLHAHVENSPMVTPGAAEAAFKRFASDARQRFRIETVRAHEGDVRTQEDTAPRDRGEGSGIVVVTVVVAARKHLGDVHQPEDARTLHALLTEFGSLGAGDLAALEVIWSPSAEDDRMTAEELARLYPEMRRIRDDTVRSRVFCGYCGSPFWLGNMRCPHCGAPTVDARQAGQGHG